MVQVHVTPRGGERCSLVPDGPTFALGPAVLARGDDPPEPGFARPLAETVGAGRCPVTSLPTIRRRGSRPDPSAAPPAQSLRGSRPGPRPSAASGNSSPPAPQRPYAQVRVTTAGARWCRRGPWCRCVRWCTPLWDYPGGYGLAGAQGTIDPLRSPLSPNDPP